MIRNQAIPYDSTEQINNNNLLQKKESSNIKYLVITYISLYNTYSISSLLRRGFRTIKFIRHISLDLTWRILQHEQSQRLAEPNITAYFSAVEERAVYLSAQGDQKYNTEFYSIWIVKYQWYCTMLI